MSPVAWSASMVTPATQAFAAPLFQKVLRLDGGRHFVTKAVLHITALGVYEATLDGIPVSSDVLSPGWSAYERRLRYRTHDVTHLVSNGAQLAVVLGNGWYRGRLGFTGRRQLYGDDLGLFAQLEIDFADGHRQIIVTDNTWTVHNSDVLSDDLYDGQTIDARRRSLVSLSSGESIPVRELAFDRDRLTPYIGPPVERQESIGPSRVWTSPTGRTLVDFGQNIVGWLRFTVRGPRGSEIRVRHAEVIEDGELGVRPLRDAQATDRFILSGGTDTFEPTFTFHGFRYAEVTGWPGTLDADSLEAVVVHSDLRRTGYFECSDTRLSQLHRNVVWSTRGNFLDLPTDCPQRNERMGWTGDIAVFAPTAMFLFDATAFLSDWLLDLAAEQKDAGGRVPTIVPDIFKLMPSTDEPVREAAAIWSDAAVWVPWAVFQASGDLSVLHRQFESMKAHVLHVEQLLSPDGVWDQGFQFGDWLDPDAPPEDPTRVKADPGVVATASIYRSAQITTSVAAMLGREQDRNTLAGIAGMLRRAFNDQYVHADGTILSDCPTVYALAVAFDLLDPDREQLAGKRLAELVGAAEHRITTGFAGTPYICDALARTGHLDTAYALLMQTDCPSWLYPVTMGATTTWERWDSMLPDGSLNPGDMTSFNHYALGAVADWLHRTVAGLAPATPGYDNVVFAPKPGGGLTWAATSLATAHGEIAIRWEIAGDELIVETVVPAGVKGLLVFPDGTEVELAVGRTTTKGQVSLP